MPLKTTKPPLMTAISRRCVRYDRYVRYVRYVRERFFKKAFPKTL